MHPIASIKRVTLSNIHNHGNSTAHCSSPIKLPKALDPHNDWAGHRVNNSMFDWRMESTCKVETSHDLSSDELDACMLR